MRMEIKPRSLGNNLFVFEPGSQQQAVSEFRKGTLWAAAATPVLSGKGKELVCFPCVTLGNQCPLFKNLTSLVLRTCSTVTHERKRQLPSCLPSKKFSIPASFSSFILSGGPFGH